MKNLFELSEKITEIFQQSEGSFGHFQKMTGLNCLAGCGKCCTAPSVSATPLEMLPMALDIVNKGHALSILDQLENERPLSCIFFEKHDESGEKGTCTQYEFRPSVCRSFGAAAVKDKYGNKVLSVCKKIKEHYPKAYHEALTKIDESPVIGEFAKRIQNLDPLLSREILPINEAFIQALKKVLFIDQMSKNSLDQIE